MVDIRNPSSPTFAGCYSDDGYTHDAECVIYKFVIGISCGLFNSFLVGLMLDTLVMKFASY